ncbi:ABC transporter ATP-binding protein [Shinella sp.]|uniref:ABC transporter ATP-binding protein n=1 Tax=Shinella sp. TaxID=1870904 RepID=UPI00258AB175|nr:ABC transporter ATP-binding protein [Shinella sp.]MCW5710663.1 ABC transporter ATP-binding protein [Shinella sp.]
MVPSQSPAISSLDGSQSGSFPTGGSVASRSPIILENLSKSYGAVKAVRRVSLELKPGQVTAIVGENGAGKSTLMKMLAGVELPDAGSISIQRKNQAFRSAKDAVSAGIGMVFQEMALVPGLTVWENVAVGWETDNWSGLDKPAIRSRIRDVCELYGLPLPVDMRVEDLPVSIRQQVEIVKVLYRDVNAIILDEPTGILTPQETRGLFDAIRSLRDLGKSVVFISHKLKEVLEIADDIYVMRSGEIVANVSPGALEPKELAALMIGRDLPTIKRSSMPKSGKPVLEVKSLTTTRFTSTREIGPLDLRVDGGRIVGIAGVAGSGQEEFIAALAGVHGRRAGTIRLNGASTVEIGPDIGSADAVQQLRSAGMGYIPADRGGVATLAGQPIWLSAIAGRQMEPQFCKWGWIRRGAARQFAQHLISVGSVKAHSVDVPPSALSGGNLQKLIVARELEWKPSLLIAVEPTRGIDIGAAMAIRQRLRDLADHGAAVLLVSSDLDELLDLCDEIAVFFDGKIVGEFERDQLTLELLGNAMTGLVTKA